MFTSRSKYNTVEKEPLQKVDTQLAMYNPTHWTSPLPVAQEFSNWLEITVSPNSFGK